jgi:hypothetical protein
MCWLLLDNRDGSSIEQGSPNQVASLRADNARKQSSKGDRAQVAVDALAFSLEYFLTAVAEVI